MTLLELVVTITVIGAIATVLAAAVTVTFRQQAESDSNLDVARWEQALALWLPTDLASASSIDDTATNDTIPVVGCGTECSDSSNALTVSYDDGSGPTTVSYRYGPSDRDDGFVLTRIECRGGSCSSRVILRDLAPPADSGWTAGSDAPPTNVINVEAPTGDMTARTVTVSVNGVPDAAGVDRSSSVSVTAGGVDPDVLDTPSFEGPSFIEARSGCGGPITLIVDDSGSIGAAITDVRKGVESFVRAFEGTPTQLKVIRFDGGASTIGTSGWHRTFDLSEPADVTELVGDATPGVGGYLGDIVDGGWTDWQEPLIRALYTDASATTTFADAGDPSKPAPELVVFFTDGRAHTDSGIPAVSEVPGEWQLNGDTIAWWRANETLEANTSTTRFIGVGVGSAFSSSVLFDDGPGGAWPDTPIPARVLLGDLIAPISTPIAYSGTENFETVEYNASTGWGDVSTAHMLTTSDFGQLGGALAAIALEECGGTLTVQTRDSAGDPANAEVTYTAGTEQVTTNAFNKSGTFDVPFGGATSADMQLVPSGSGFVATGWTCKAGGVDLVEGSDWSLLTAGDPGAGINVTVTPNAAVSCTMEVA